MTVGELRELLADYPDHQLVTVAVQVERQGAPVLTIGVLETGTLMQSSGHPAFPDDRPTGIGTTPVLVLGELP